MAAVTTSLLVKGPSSVVASYLHFAREDLHMDLAFPLLLGLVGSGAQTGPRLSHRISKKRLPQLFGLVLLHAAANVVVNGLR